ncbi:hypothetical protein [Methylobacterium nodulans]|uniref:hypothetical protein n=1 Tax=Methylobacterium nodulans TaxID=114616 RepID=UPI0005C26514|nr:hypothetical protein [Methylobacterium nodulans]
MLAPRLEGLFQGPKQFLGLRGVLALLGHPLDQGDLLDHALLARGDIHISLGEMIAFCPNMGHGTADHAPDRARKPEISRKAALWNAKQLLRTGFARFRAGLPGRQSKASLPASGGASRR